MYPFERTVLTELHKVATLKWKKQEQNRFRSNLEIKLRKFVNEPIAAEKAGAAIKGLTFVYS